MSDLVGQGVTLFLDLTEDGELEPYSHLVAGACALGPDARFATSPCPRARRSWRRSTLSTRSSRRGGVVFVHCWAGCGRTGVVVGCWLVRHGSDPHDALARIAESRGLGCPQTLEQRLTVLAWKPGD